MTRIRFRLRTLLAFTMFASILLAIAIERRRYLREHVFLSAIDRQTNAKLSHFRYRTAIVIQTSGIAKEWSDWQTVNSDQPVSLNVPSQCRLSVEAQAIGFPSGWATCFETLLVQPEGSHSIQLVIPSTNRATGRVLNAVTNEPVEGVVIVPIARASPVFHRDEDRTKPDGSFEVYSESTQKNVLVFHPKYQFHFCTLNDADTILLSPAKQVIGRIVDAQSGMPIPDCKVTADYKTCVPIDPSQVSPTDFEKDDGTVSQLRTSKLDRSSMTDEQGNFQIYLEPLALNTKLIISKKGWQNAIVLAINAGREPIQMIRERFELAAKVVDAEGSPIRQFSVLFHEEKHEFDTEDGSFKIFSKSPIHQASISASGYATYAIENWNSTQSSSTPFRETNLRIFSLSSGSRVQGYVDRQPFHTRSTQAFLYKVSTTQNRERSAWLASDVPSPYSFSLFPQDHQSLLNSSGFYTFANVADGNYALVVSYNDQVFEVRPVQVDSRDVQLPNISIPRIGSVSGTMQEFASEMRFNPKKLEPNPFGLYSISGFGGTLEGKRFRVNERGDFKIDHILSGKNLISSVLNLSNEPRKTANFPVSIATDRVTGVLDPPIVICKVEAPPSTHRFYTTAVAGATLRSRDLQMELLIEHGSEKSQDGFDTFNIYGPSDLISGTYILDLIGSSNTRVQLDYRRNQEPQTKRLHERMLLLVFDQDIPHEQELSQVSICRNGNLIATASRFYRDENPGIPILLEGAEPCDIVLQSKNICYVSKNQTIGVDGIQLVVQEQNMRVWQGVTLRLQIDMSRLDLFPCSCRLTHLETGFEIDRRLNSQQSLNEAIEFQHVINGQWKIEVWGLKPLVGKVILFEKRIDIEGSQDVDLRCPE